MLGLGRKSSRESLSSKTGFDNNKHETKTGRKILYSGSGIKKKMNNSMKKRPKYTEKMPEKARIDKIV